MPKVKVHWDVGCHLFVFLIIFIRGPERQVIPEQLENQGRIFVGVFAGRVQFGNRGIESFLGQFTGLLGVLCDFIVVHRKVQGQSQSDRVRGGEVLCHFLSQSVGSLSLLTQVRSLVIFGNFYLISEIAYNSESSIFSTLLVVT